MRRLFFQAPLHPRQKRFAGRGNRKAGRACHSTTLLAWLMGMALLGVASGSSACEDVGYIARFDVREGHEAAFEAALLALVHEVRATESGVLLYAPFKGDEPRQYFMMERYVDAAARERHASTPNVRALFAPIVQHLASDLQVHAVSALCEAGSQP